MQRTIGRLPGGRDGRRLGGNGEGVKEGEPVVTEQSRGVKYSPGNTISNTVVTMCGARRVLDSLRGSLDKLHKCLIVVLCP